MDILVADGHDVATVAGQRLIGAQDTELIEACRVEGRALVTLDKDFSNPLVYPPARYAGIAVLRLRSKPSPADLIAVMKTLADAVQKESPGGRLWTVERGRIRIYQPPDEPD